MGSVIVNIKNLKVSIDKEIIEKLGDDPAFMGFDLDGKGRPVAVHLNGTTPVEDLLIKREKGHKIQFKDGNKLNLVASNVEVKKRTSLKGVYYYPKNQMRKWKAIISLNGKKKALGYFSTEKEAHAAYLEALELSKKAQ